MGTTGDAFQRIDVLPVVPFKDNDIDEVLDVIESREHPYNERKILPLLRLLEK